MALFGFGFDESDSKGTQRQDSRTVFPSEFLSNVNKTIGGPFTMGDLFRLAPRPWGLPESARGGSGERPNEGFTLGFGLPQSLQPGGGQPGTGGTAPAPTAPEGPQTFNISDIRDAWREDPEKLMDVERLFRQANLDPNSFTYDEFEAAVSKGKKFGFSGRSMGNFSRALSMLSSTTEAEDIFGGRAGSGVF